MIKEACGVVGIYDLDGSDIASNIYYSLLALQHRGQESCGIAVSNTNDKNKNISSYKDMGLVNDLNICTSCFTGKYPFKNIKDI